MNKKIHKVEKNVLGCPWKLIAIVSKLACFTYLGEVSNLLI